MRIESTVDGGLKFTALTKQARAEMLTQQTQRQSIEPFLDAATTDTSTNSEAGRVLFELLIPHELKNKAQDNANLMLVLDDASAAYPWELLEYGSRDGNQVLAQQAGMIRQLATHDYSRPNLCMNGHALVIGDPKSDFPELSGARKEARMVADLLTRQFGGPEPLIRPSGQEILTKLMAHEYQILHLAGHGFVDHELPSDPNAPCVCDRENERKPKTINGMVIGRNHFLTPIEIRQMPATPELVFINCCYLGLTQDNRTFAPDRPHRLAANLATQLIRQGVRAVIAAGWAVDDSAAHTFATTFYTKMLFGMEFGEAVSAARKETAYRHPSCNTWGAYQCYGEPGYRLTTNGSRERSPSKRKRVSVSEYIADIRNLTEDAKTAEDKEIRSLRRRLESIAVEIPKRWSSDGELQATLGQAWGELDLFERAIAAYQRALTVEDGRATIRAAEQLANLKARLAVDQSVTARDYLNNKQRSDATRHYSKAKKLLAQASSSLNRLNREFGESIERLALLGSVCKRGALVYRNAEEDEQKSRKKMVDSLTEMSSYYERAYAQALQDKGTDPYPLLTWLTARWLLHELDSRQKLPTDASDHLHQAEAASPVPELNREHFWNAITQADCRLLRALYEGTLAAQWGDIGEQYRNTRQVAASPRQFRSVIEHLEFLRDILSRSKSNQTADALDQLISRLRSL